MEDIQDRTFLMKPLTLNDLTVPLSQIVRKKCPRIDLLLGVVDKNEINKFLEITMPLAAKLGYSLKDTCCVFLHQLGPNRWKVLSTHGNAQILAVGEDFEVSVCHNYQSPQETPILNQLFGMRNALLSQSLGLSRIIDIPYPKIRGNVLLCGDFSVWELSILLGLRKIFIANGAENVVFVTPVISSRRCQKLEKERCNIVRLHPLEGSTA